MAIQPVIRCKIIKVFNKYQHTKRIASDNPACTTKPVGDFAVVNG